MGLSQIPAETCPLSAHLLSLSPRTLLAQIGRQDFPVDLLREASVLRKGSVECREAKNRYLACRRSRGRGNGDSMEPERRHLPGYGFADPRRGQ